MFTVNQLIELLEEYREAGQGDRPVHIAIQPRYPLALRLRGVADGTDAVEDPTDEAEVSESVVARRFGLPPRGCGLRAGGSVGSCEAMMSWPVEVHSAAALREIADAVWDVWTEDVDDDVAAMAREAARVLRRLAERVERG